MGFTGVDVDDKDEGDDAPDAPEWNWRDDVSWRRLAIVCVYLVALVGVGAVVARKVSTAAGAAFVVAGLFLLAVLAFRSRRRWADAGMVGGDGVYGVEGGWDVGGDGGGDGGGGGGGD